jgi:hypothetical protein
MPRQGPRRWSDFPEFNGQNFRNPHFAVVPHAPRNYCLIDGQDTYKILKAYDLLPRPGSEAGGTTS